MPGTVILISGGRQVGKTTALLRVRETARAEGRRVGGFLSVARFDAETKTGIDLLDAATGVVVPLAEVVTAADAANAGEVRTGHYRFNPAALEAGLRYAAAGQAADVFFVDELGPLELVRGAGWAAVLPMVRARRFGVALVVVRPELIALAREQMELPPETPTVTVTAADREAAAAQLIEWLRAALSAT